MTQVEFANKYDEFLLLAMGCSEKARREGFLALEEKLDQEKIAERDIFYLGLCLAIDRVNIEIIEKILSNIVKQENDEYMLLFKNIQKEAVLSIQEGLNPRLLATLLLSYITSEETNEPERKVLEE
jgi:flagellar motor component MotA